MTVVVHAWRHPRPEAVVGRCIGRTDVPLDRRRAKRLAHRIRAHVRRHGGPRTVWTSPLERCAAVGPWLRRFGFEHRIDADLLELDFGAWDGRPWTAIGADAVAAWEADFVHHAPGGGEPLAALLARVRRFVAARGRDGAPLLLVTHAGWINALRWQQGARPGDVPQPADWPGAPRYGEPASIAIDAPAP